MRYKYSIKFNTNIGHGFDFLIALRQHVLRLVPWFTTDPKTNNLRNVHCDSSFYRSPSTLNSDFSSSGCSKYITTNRFKMIREHHLYTNFTKNIWGEVCDIAHRLRIVRIFSQFLCFITTIKPSLSSTDRIDEKCIV